MLVDGHHHQDLDHYTRLRGNVGGFSAWHNQSEINFKSNTISCVIMDSRADSGSAVSRDQALAKLRDAIYSVPEDRLRSIVADLVEAVPAVQQAFFKELVTLKSRKKRTATEDDFVSRWEVCKNCGEDYDAGMKRRDGECRYHPAPCQPTMTSSQIGTRIVTGP
ncbi:hypothetical protein AcW1_008228 [Taiwanofungus camphoratus]|nr:hypothetical protein AcW1_008228 [Antrodia cinnamomea]KAI0955989.1 hypothetical protein AcV7_006514 [Antrodia cinnamomea]